MSEKIISKFEQDWQKAALFAHLTCNGLPPWAAGRDMGKALAALTGWSKQRCVSALEEAVRRGMLAKEDADTDSIEHDMNTQIKTVIKDILSWIDKNQPNQSLP